jgi:hypothetical protein
MGLFDFFRSKPAPRPEPALDVMHDLTLSRMLPGYLVDFEMRTYQVRDRAEADYGQGRTATEWDLRAADDRIRLLGEPERGDIRWTVLREVPLGEIDGDVRHDVVTSGDPAPQLFFQSVPYVQDRTGAGYLRRQGGRGPEEGFVYWTYSRADDPSRVLRLEQVSETEVAAAAGERVEEYRFANILPGPGRV